MFCTIAAGLMFAPWVLSESALSGGASSWHGFVDALGIVQVLGSNFASDDHLPAAIEPAFNALLLVLVVAGAAVLLLRLLGLKRSCGKPPPRFGVALTLVWLILPLALVYAISLRQPLFSPRYFIVALPPYLLLAAVALAALPRAAGAGLVGMLAAGSVWAVVRANTVPQYAKEDFRLAAHYISQRSQADDVIGLLANYTVYPFEYYFEGAGRVVPVDVQPDSD
ncbi:MAG TPA: hypothetical protein VFS62_08810, partial [Chloroflexota bacterium]|nr:hypothetical protein [Chloroflexota bacterium]